AAYSGDIEILKLILDAGAKINHTNDKVLPPLILALWEKHEHMAEFLLAAGVDVKRPSPTTGNSALSLALQDEFFDLALKIIDAGADVSHLDSNNGSALHIASEKADIEIVSRLLDAGASATINVATKGQGWTALHSATNKNRPHTVALLVQAGADVNARGYENRTALVYAAMNGMTDTVNLLLKHGADVNAADDHGWSPLIGAVFGKNAAIASTLIEAGADMNFKSKEGLTAYLYAILEEMPELAATLIDSGMDISGLEGTIALTAAARYKHMDLVKRLLSANVELDVLWSKTDHSPLISAVVSGDADIVQAIIDAGANPFMANKAGGTPLSGAQARQFTKIVEMIKKAQRNYQRKPSPNDD
ncbi:MAG: ankyrin repeat domain-containing protein, partial [Gammaproteobacteria bacterium]|nr:ankyrin repeat domain-containing protein [Gammaproteobacteria bacterium]